MRFRQATLAEADEGESWLVGADRAKVLPAYFRCLSATAAPEEYAHASEYVLQAGDSATVTFDDPAQALLHGWNSHAHPGCTLSQASGKTTVTFSTGFGRATVQGGPLAANATLNVTSTVVPVLFSGTAINLGIATFFSNSDPLWAASPTTEPRATAPPRTADLLKRALMNSRYSQAALTAVAAVAVTLGLCAACGGEAHQSAADAGAGAGNAGNPADASTPDAQAAAGAIARGGACGSTPVPVAHRAVAQACPAARGSSGPLDTSTCTNRAGITCTKDADCTAGKNGRCFATDVCETACSYDECLTDSDCAAGPCLCRRSGSDPLRNQCLPGRNCKTDADCNGGCGYCSPSAVPAPFNCTVGTLAYNCHTANDECADQSACGDGGEYCAYDAGAARWGCGFCAPLPHL